MIFRHSLQKFSILILIPTREKYFFTQNAITCAETTTVFILLCFESFQTIATKIMPQFYHSAFIQISVALPLSFIYGLFLSIHSLFKHPASLLIADF